MHFFYGLSIFVLEGACDGDVGQGLERACTFRNNVLRYALF